jgi:hypothetical protein
VTDTAVASYVHQPFYVQLCLGTQFAFQFVIFREDLTDSVDVIVILLIYLHVAVDAGSVKHFLCRAASDPIDIGKSYLSLLVPW